MLIGRVGTPTNFRGRGRGFGTPKKSGSGSGLSFKNFRGRGRGSGICQKVGDVPDPDSGSGFYTVITQDFEFFLKSGISRGFFQNFRGRGRGLLSKIFGVGVGDRGSKNKSGTSPTPTRVGPGFQP